ncbi:MAG: hypothetical protein ACI4W7_02630 [Candidatus Spyradenecus sp.]
MQQNPPIVLEAVTRPHPLSMGLMALLEKIASPFVGEPRVASIREILPSLYLCHIPYREAIAAAYSEDLEALALAWAEGMGAAEYRERVDTLNAAISDFFGALPRPETDAEGKPKKA